MLPMIRLSSRLVRSLGNPMTNQSSTQKRQKVSPRKAPTQARSKEKVKKILAAASQLLATDGLDKLTNNHIAKAAGMSVGSLYQYFPNKQAIIYSLYQDWLSHIVEIMNQGLSRATEISFASLLDEIMVEIYGTPQESANDRELENELIKAMALYPELQAIDRQHGEVMARLFADIFQAAGLTCDDETAYQLGIFIYSFDSARRESLYLGGSPEMTTTWFRQSLDRVFEPYLPKENNE